MLATRLRVSPWSDRLSRSSSCRVTLSCRADSSKETPISGRWAKLSLPLGPSTSILESTIETFTLAGTGTGFRPIRDMGPSSSTCWVLAHAGRGTGASLFGGLDRHAGRPAAAPRGLDVLAFVFVWPLGPSVDPRSGPGSVHQRQDLAA